MSKQPPQQANAVIIGGGVIGASVAYHLAHAGMEDVVLLERKQLACGTTWHAAGLVAQLRATPTLTALAKYSTTLYGKLQDETGQDTGYRQKGALNLAASEGLLQEYKRACAFATRESLPATMLSPNEIKERCPQVNTDGILGGLWLPTDGQINPLELTRALAMGAKQRGAQILENTPAQKIITRKGRVVGVQTAAGVVATNRVVIAAGMWSRELAASVGVALPLHACEHYYIVTEPVEGLPPSFPTIRDVAARAYYKEDAGKILLGGFEERARPWGQNGIPEDFCFDSLPGEFSQFEPILEKAMERLPLLQTAGIRLFFCGPESFTPDNKYHLGEAPTLRGCYVAAGMNSIGIQSAGGVGKALAEWIVNDAPAIDIAGIAAARAMPFMRNRQYAATRAAESLGVLYDVHWPHKQMTSARQVRLSPLHDALANAGACFGETAGWERANWFLPGARAPQYQYAFGRQNWFEWQRRECLAAGNAAALVDLSSFGKFRVLGEDAAKWLDRVCANNIQDAPVGKIVYTAWLNNNGGFEADLTVTRLAENDFLVLSGAPTQARDFAWLMRHKGEDDRAEAFDVTSAYAILGLFGPKAFEVLRAAGAGRLPAFGCAAEVEAGAALALAMRISYAGEAGAELLVASEFALNVYRALQTAGQPLGLVNAGFHAVDSMRMEKARRHFGDDITNTDTPLQAGLGFAVDYNKDFVGKAALLAQRERPIARRLAHFALVGGANAPLLFGEEPLLRDGKIVGGVTSAAYGHRVNKSLALAYATNAEGAASREWLASGRWQINIGGLLHDAEYLPQAPYDGKNQLPTAAD